MANSFQPFGFAESHRLGASPDYQLSTRKIAQANTTAIYVGDPVQWATGTTGASTGYIRQAVAPVAISVTSLSWATGVLTLNYSAISAAPALGSFVVFSGFSTATGINGAWGPILTASTTSFTLNFPATQSTDTGTATVYQPIAGIFVGCEYQSTSLRRPVWGYWPGTSDATADASCKIIDDPLMVFRCQGNAQITQAMVGQNAQFAIGSGSTVLNGRSGAYLDISNYTPAPLAYYPFRIVNLIDVPPPPAPGTDTTSAYNWAYVTFNNQDYRQLAGI